MICILKWVTNVILECVKKNNKRVLFVPIYSFGINGVLKLLFFSISERLLPLLSGTVKEA